MEIRMKIDAGKRVTIDRGDGNPYIAAVGTGSLELVASYEFNDSYYTVQVSMAGSLSSVRSLVLGSTDLYVGGPIIDYTNFPNLEVLEAPQYNSFASGDIGSLSGMLVLNTIRMPDSNITGDIGQLSSLLQLSELDVSVTNVTYVTTTLPVWNEVSLNFENCGWVEAMVDVLLADLDTSGAIDGELNLLGCAAPGTAGAASIVSLQSKGWTVDTE